MEVKQVFKRNFKVSSQMVPLRCRSVPFEAYIKALMDGLYGFMEGKIQGWLNDLAPHIPDSGGGLPSKLKMLFYYTGGNIFKMKSS